MKTLQITTFIITLFLLSNFVYHRIPFTKEVLVVDTCMKDYNMNVEDYTKAQKATPYILEHYTELTEKGELKNYYYNCESSQYDVDNFLDWENGFLLTPQNIYNKDKVSVNIKEVTYYK